MLGGNSIRLDEIQMVFVYLPVQISGSISTFFKTRLYPTLFLEDFLRPTNHLRLGICSEWIGCEIGRNLKMN
jgi:hypothetical protein